MHANSRGLVLRPGTVAPPRRWQPLPCPQLLCHHRGHLRGSLSLRCFPAPSAAGPGAGSVSRQRRGCLWASPAAAHLRDAPLECARLQGSTASRLQGCTASHASAISHRTRHTPAAGQSLSALHISIPSGKKHSKGCASVLKSLSVSEILVWVTCRWAVKRRTIICPEQGHPGKQAFVAWSFSSCSLFFSFCLWRPLASSTQKFQIL